MIQKVTDERCIILGVMRRFCRALQTMLRKQVRPKHSVDTLHHYTIAGIAVPQISLKSELCQYRIPRCPDKRFDLEILLDALKE